MQVAFSNGGKWVVVEAMAPNILIIFQAGESMNSTMQLKKPSPKVTMNNLLLIARKSHLRRNSLAQTRRGIRKSERHEGGWIGLKPTNILSPVSGSYKL